LDEPIVILAFPRTGSSMVAGVFKRHGVFSGRCPEPSIKIPTGSVESIGLKRILKADYPQTIDELKEFVHGFKEKITKVMKTDGYKEGPWLAKHAAIYWPIWEEFTPKFVLVRRNFEAVIKSNKQSNMAGMQGQRLERAWELNLYEMQKLHDRLHAPWVDSDKVVRGNYSSLEDAFEYCGLELDKKIANDFINPRHWHY
jgi:hypothetical protein